MSQIPCEIYIYSLCSKHVSLFQITELDDLDDYQAEDPSLGHEVLEAEASFLHQATHDAVLVGSSQGDVNPADLPNTSQFPRLRASLSESVVVGVASNQAFHLETSWSGPQCAPLQTSWSDEPMAEPYNQIRPSTGSGHQLDPDLEPSPVILRPNQQRKRSMMTTPSEGGIAPAGGRSSSQGGSAAWGRKMRTPRTTLESIGGADIAAGYDVLLAPAAQQQLSLTPEAIVTEKDSDTDSPPRGNELNGSSLNEYGSDDEPPMSYSATKRKPDPGSGEVIPWRYSSSSPSPMIYPIYATTRELRGYAKTPQQLQQAWQDQTLGLDVSLGTDEDLMAGPQSWAADSVLNSGGAAQLPPWLTPPQHQLLYSGGQDGVRRSADPRDHSQVYSDQRRPSIIPGECEAT